MDEKRPASAKNKNARKTKKGLDTAPFFLYNKRAGTITFRLHSEKYSRGRRGAPAKGVGRATGARVQISPSPPSETPIEPRFNRGLTTQRVPRAVAGDSLRWRRRRDLNRATGSGARVNEPKTVRWTVFGEAKAPKQGAFRAVIYGGDGRRLATRRALACIARRDNLSFSAPLVTFRFRCGTS